MKKKFFMGVAAAALIAGGFAMSKNSTGKVLTPLQAENLEALTSSEGSFDDCEDGCSTSKHRVFCCRLLGMNLYKYN